MSPDIRFPALSGDVANSIGLQAIVGAIARTHDADFDLDRTLRALAEVTQGAVGARGVTIERVRAGGPALVLASAGETGGTPRRLPIIADGRELGFIAIYGAPMLGPATADRTQVLADLAAIALARKDRVEMREPVTMDDGRYRLISGVGHNLRNTLGAATGYMQLVEMEGALSATQQEHVNRGRRAVTAAITLIGDLIELTRADAGKLAFDSDPLNVNAVARETARKHKDAAALKDAMIVVDAATSNPVVLTDSSYIREIVDVLVYNAVRYTRQGGEVRISVALREGRRAGDPPHWVCVSVRDSGKGVPDGDRIFEEVHRVEQSKGNVRFKLAICRRIARLLGGDLTLDSSEAEGATFTLWLALEGAT